jgi:hypothetical protein
LSNGAQKRFPSLVWEFRRDPQDVKPEEREALKRLFGELPVLKDLYDVRVRIKEIFDTAPDCPTPEQQLAELRALTDSLGRDFQPCWRTCEN